MFEATIVNILSNIWPMLAIFTVILVSYRLAYLKKNQEKFILYKEILLLAFVIYIMCLFYVVTFQDVSWSTSNFIPFREIFRYDFGSFKFMKNVVGNMIMFFPYGFFISYFLKLEKKNTIIYLTIIVSLSIEVTQLLIGRVFDVDDIILNICGGLFGYLMYRFLVSIKNHLPRFLKNDIAYNIVIVMVISVAVWYLYQIMWLGV